MSTPKVVLLTQDLMFGSKVEGMIRAAQAEPVLAQTPTEALEKSATCRLLIVDLTAEQFDGKTTVAAGPIPTLGFYAHTDDDTRKAALAAGFNKVVPRSRMMREGVEIISAMISADPITSRKREHKV